MSIINGKTFLGSLLICYIKLLIEKKHIAQKCFNMQYYMCFNSFSIILELISSSKFCWQHVAFVFFLPTKQKNAHIEFWHVCVYYKQEWFLCVIVHHGKNIREKNGGQHGSTEEWVGYWLKIKMALRNYFFPWLVKIQNIHLW